jgi:hypothetical protein
VWNEEVMQDQSDQTAGAPMPAAALTRPARRSGRQMHRLAASRLALAVAVMSGAISLLALTTPALAALSEAACQQLTPAALIDAVDQGLCTLDLLPAAGPSPSLAESGGTTGEHQGNGDGGSSQGGDPGGGSGSDPGGGSAGDDGGSGGSGGDGGPGPGSGGDDSGSGDGGDTHDGDGPHADHHHHDHGDGEHEGGDSGHGCGGSER